MNLKQKLLYVNIIKNDGKINCNSRKMLFGNYSYIYDQLLNETKFIPVNRPHFLKEKIAAIKNDVMEIPKCGICSNFSSFNPHINEYNEFCSDKNCFKKERLKRFRQGMQKKYGVEHAFQNDILFNKFKNTMEEKYGVNFSNENLILKTKMQSTMRDRYGTHARTRIHLSTEILKMVDDSSWLYNKHYKEKLSLVQIANELNVSESLIQNRFAKFKIPIINFYSSMGEQQIIMFLEGNNIPIITRNRSIIPPYELDIFIPSHNLAIEYCGLYWHCEINKDKNYHKIKYDLCKNKGIRLLTIFENEWIRKELIIKKTLLHILNLSKEDKIFARKCIIKEVVTEEKIKFFDVNHIQGNGPSSINIGLYYNNDLVACMGFIKSYDSYILNRYATSKIIVGGFTKLLAYFEKVHKFQKIITFADLRWSNGKVYEQSGFKFDKLLYPDYSYILNNETYHKFGFRHKQLKNILKDKYNNKISEHKNCIMNGIYRIYDCGKLRFIKNDNN